MKTGFSDPAARFQSASQTARVDTEGWAASQMYCPNCGNPKLSRFKANQPVADFYCDGCGDEFELKSQRNRFGNKVADGAYSTKIERLASGTSPHLLLLQYDQRERRVRNLRAVPKFFFVPSLIEKRAPLGPNARRAGWVGSNILLDRIPKHGQIAVIEEGAILSRDNVLEAWNRLRFLQKRTLEARGWLLEVMRCVETIDEDEFTLGDVYAFEERLQSIFPKNKNVRPKIRQQLQVLRDSGHLSFVGGGRYRLIR